MINTDTNEYLPCIEIFVYAELKILEYVLFAVTYVAAISHWKLIFLRSFKNTVEQMNTPYLVVGKTLDNGF